MSDLSHTTQHGGEGGLPGSSSSSAGHMINMIVPIALFLVFAITAIMVVLFSARAYEGIADRSSDNYTARTSVAYITQKVHQYDTAGGVKIGEFDGHPALVLTDTNASSQSAYSTYLYASSGSLREITLKPGVQANAAAGTEVMPLKSLKIKEVGDHLIRIDIQAAGSSPTHTYIAVRSS